MFYDEDEYFDYEDEFNSDDYRCSLSDIREMDDAEIENFFNEYGEELGKLDVEVEEY